MDAAEKYKNRHRAVTEYANGAMFNVAELDAWAVANKFPLSFEQLFASPDGADNYAPEHHYVSFEILADVIAWNIVPEDASPDDARQQLKAAHDTTTPDDPVSRLRDLVMVRYNNALLSAVYDGNLNLFDTLAYGKVDVEAARLGYNEDPDAFLEGSRARIIARQPVAAQHALAHAGTVLKDDTTACITDGGATWTSEVVASITEQAAYWERRQPAPLFAGPGFSDEALKQTTLTRYLDFDTWTPAAAAMLVCGLQAPINNGQLCTEIPAGRVKGLDGLWKSEQNCTAIADAKRVLGIWRSQVNPPARVRPLDFVEWCQGRGFDIAWLRSIEDDVLSKERGAMKAALGSGVVVVPSASHFADWLADHIAFSLVAIPDDEQLTTVFKETVIKQEPWLVQSKRELLTSDEWRLVRSICGNPPAPCSRTQFEEWRGKFNAAGNKPEWSLDGDFRWSDGTVKAQARWTDVSEAHRQRFEQMAKKGDLSLVTPDGTPTTDITKGRMSRDDFIRYLQSCGLQMQGAVAVSGAPAVGAQTDVVAPATARRNGPEPDRPKQAIPIESLFTEPGFERNYQVLVTEPGSSPIKTAITSALIASAKAGEALAASIRTIKKKGEKWSDAELRTLLDESKMPDFTQKAAGEKYGVKPQRISRLLQQAKEKFEASAKASKFPTANLSGRKVRGRNY